MSAPKVVNADAKIAVEREDDKITVSLQLTGLPNDIMVIIKKKQDDLIPHLIKAVLMNLGVRGKVMDSDEIKARMLN